MTDNKKSLQLGKIANKQPSLPDGGDVESSKPAHIPALHGAASATDSSHLVAQTSSARPIPILWLITTQQLCIVGTIACIVQVVFTVGMSFIEYFVVYLQTDGTGSIPLTSAAVASIPGLLGIAGLLLQHNPLLSLHCVGGAMFGALSGALRASSYFQKELTCSMQQAAFLGCMTCVCAAQNRCKQRDLRSSGCKSCKALGTDTCSAINTLRPLAIALAVVQVLLSLLPVAVSLLVLVRKEPDQGVVADELQDKRQIVSQCVALLKAGKPPAIELAELKVYIDDLLNFGNSGDKKVAEMAQGLMGRPGGSGGGNTGGGVVSKEKTPAGTASTNAMVSVKSKKNLLEADSSWNTDHAVTAMPAADKPAAGKKKNSSLKNAAALPVEDFTEHQLPGMPADPDAVAPAAKGKKKGKKAAAAAIEASESAPDGTWNPGEEEAHVVKGKKKKKKSASVAEGEGGADEESAVPSAPKKKGKKKQAAQEV